METHEVDTSAECLNAQSHLDAELRWLARVVGSHIAYLRAHVAMTQESFLGLYVPDEAVDEIIGPDEPTSRAPRPSREDLDALVDRSLAAGARLPLAAVARRLALTPLERSVLLLSLVPELDLRWENVIAYAQNDAARRRATAQFALQLLGDGADAARLEDSVLLRDRWLRLTPSPQRLGSRFLGLELVPCDELVRFVQGRRQAHLPAPVQASLSARVLSEPLRARAREVGASVGPESAVLVRGPEGSGRRAVAAEVALACGHATLEVDFDLVAKEEAPSVISALGRACLLTAAAPVLHHADALLDDARATREVLALLARRQGPVLLTVARGRLPEAVELETGVPESPMRAELWRRALGVDDSLAVVSEVAARFHLTPRQIEQAAAKVGPRVDGPSLFAAARSTCTHQLDRLATNITVRASFSDLIVPAHVEAQLEELVSACRQRQRVLFEWEFARRVSHGLGTYALLAGPSGTGKTLAASVVASELGLELFRVDLSSVVSKYIGETEKNLDAVFREAEAASAMLLFDEADALFGARSEVSDARDRYANMEVAFLLQRMEAYEGVVVLTSNLRKNMDDAFTRRIQHIIELPLPDASLRLRLFDSLLPTQAPVDPGLDFTAYARRFEFTGGHIRNVLLAAAGLAAQEGTPICERHVLHAISRELQKLGRLSEKALLRPDAARQFPE